MCLSISANVTEVGHGDYKENEKESVSVESSSENGSIISGQDQPFPPSQKTPAKARPPQNGKECLSYP